MYLTLRRFSTGRGDKDLSEVTDKRGDAIVRHTINMKIVELSHRRGERLAYTPSYTPRLKIELMVCLLLVFIFTEGVLEHVTEGHFTLLSDDLTSVTRLKNSAKFCSDKFNKKLLYFYRKFASFFFEKM